MARTRQGNGASIVELSAPGFTQIFYEEDALFLSPDEPPVDSAIAARSTPAVWNEYISRRAAETAQKTTEIKAKIEKLRARLADPSRKRPEEHYLLARLQAEVGCLVPMMAGM